jgi:hypothetical protein
MPANISAAPSVKQSCEKSNHGDAIITAQFLNAISEMPFLRLSVFFLYLTATTTCAVHHDTPRSPASAAYTHKIPQ